MEHLVCTLFEKDYHYGAAALINSLCANGFKGTFFGALRGDFPAWAATAEKIGPHTRRFSPTQDVEVILEQINPTVHLAHYKPTLMLELLERFSPQFIYYFDPDIVLKGKWNQIERWVGDGIGICEDIRADVSPFHPQKIGWAVWLKEKGYTLARAIDSRYYNSGFIGLPASERRFIELWEELIQKIEKELGELKQLSYDDILNPFYLPDQEAFNMVTYLEDFPIRALGPEAMDFKAGGLILSHAIGPNKPWRGHFLTALQRGRPIPLPIQKFFAYIDCPLRVFPPLKRRWLKTTLKLALFVQKLRGQTNFSPPPFYY